MEEALRSLYTAILEGDEERAVSAVRRALEAGAEPVTLLQGTMIPAMGEVGRRFEAGDYFVPEMLIAAHAMQSALGPLRPLLAGTGVKPIGRAMIATVSGDLHDIGKNLVALMLEGAGFEILDLGVNVSAEDIARAVEAERPDLLALSAMLTTTMTGMKTVIETLEAAGLRETVRVMVGGAPLSEAFANQIGADGYAPDASRAVALAKSLLATKEDA